MKKIISSILAFLVSSCLFSQALRITEANYEVEGAGGINIGKTQVKKLEMKYPIDTKTIFRTANEFDVYIANYKQQLMSTRLFQSVDYTYDYNLNPETNIYDVKVDIKIVDTNHLLALPYPKYSSNSGLTLKLKAKDSNFFGTLNPLSTDLYFNWEDQVTFGINFSYDFPFKAGPFNAVWNNSLYLDYTVHDKSPEFGTTMGVNFTLPFDIASLDFGFIQGIKYDKSFKLIMGETLHIASPITMYKFSNFTNLNYKPYVDFSFEWYFKPEVKTPFVDDENLRFTFGHSLSNENITFNDFFRKGYSIKLSNNITYYLKSHGVTPSFTFEGLYFNNWKLLKGNFLSRFGISTRVYARTTVAFPNSDQHDDTVNLGSKIRGVLDNQMAASNGLVINFDIPFTLFTTNFKWEIINFNMQFSPFIDLALSFEENNILNFTSKQLCAGFEVLVNPVKFSSYTIRGSIGFDAKKILKSDNKLKALLHYNEIYIGLDYHF